MDNLEELVPTIKRAVAPPGAFDDLFPESTDELLLGSLLDGMAGAQLDGFLSEHTYTDLGAVTPEITRAQGALVVIWTATTIIENQITNLKTRVNYEAKGLAFEEEQGASILVERLKGLRERKKELIELARMGDLASAFYMADLAFVKAVAEYDGSDLGYNASIVRTL